MTARHWERIGTKFSVPSLMMWVLLETKKKTKTGRDELLRTVCWYGPAAPRP